MYAARVKETSTTTGTGNMTLAGAVADYQSFNSAFGTGATAQFIYVIDDGSSNWEIGLGHLSASTTLVRDTVYASSNAGFFVSFSAATSIFNAWARGAIVDVYATTGVNTWTKRAGALVVSVSLVGGGGPGGSGYCNAAGGIRCGGGGGAGGGISLGQWQASILASTETAGSSYGASCTGLPTATSALSTRYPFSPATSAPRFAAAFDCTSAARRAAAIRLANY